MSTHDPSQATPHDTPIPTRPLGRTGVDVSIFGLGGEGVLRTFGREREARAVIDRALEQGVTYFDSARAYAGSEGYYGAALGSRRERIFLTSKAFERSKAGALAQLHETLATMKTDYLDLWQMHDMRDMRELEEVCAPGGALEAFRQARDEGKVRFLGVTGHHDPEVLSAALDIFSFDTVLMPVNPTEAHFNPFMTTTLTKACHLGMGIIGMKVPARGHLVRTGVTAFSIEPLMRYALSWPVSTVIIGCDSPQQVDSNAAAARRFVPMPEPEMRALEAAFEPYVEHGQFYKKGMH
ncbi:MAG: aldo/keto reductase [Proteobacteria bacterium]|nr:aldo/keto reductase [Pseudomonadota bacterium]